MPSLIDEHTQYVDSSGTPLASGKLYIGVQNQDPVSNPITIYSDRALTTSITNPQTLDSYGRTTNKIWVPGKYSLRLDNSADVQQYQELDNGEIDAPVIGTPLATTSGTAVDFTGIPNFTRKVIVNFSGVDTSGTDDLLIQIGDSGGIETSGYNSYSSELLITPSIGNVTSTAGFIINMGGVASVGALTLSLENETNNTWMAAGIFGGGVSVMAIACGEKDLSASLDRVRLTTTGGTDTFSTGEINILYQ